jgi:isocitrate/isopropylmalate dehydrogenase
MGQYPIAMLPGDGIGKEVVPAGREILEALADSCNNLELEFENFAAHHPCSEHNARRPLRSNDELD